MVAQQRGTDEPAGSESGAPGRSSHLGMLMFLTACGIGLGLLTAPAAGRQTRKRLRKGLSSLGSEVADRWGDAHERFDDLREAAGALMGAVVVTMAVRMQGRVCR